MFSIGKKRDCTGNSMHAKEKWMLDLFSLALRKLAVFPFGRPINCYPTDALPIVFLSTSDFSNNNLGCRVVLSCPEGK